MKKKQTPDMSASPQKNTPGYPSYPVKEDIMSKEGEERIDVNVDELSGNEDRAALKKTPQSQSLKDYSPEIISGTEADVTQEDILALGDPDGDNDEGDDELLLPKLNGDGFSGDDLDVPGSELDDDSEETGSEDEENNYYSRGQE